MLTNSIVPKLEVKVKMYSIFTDFEGPLLKLIMPCIGRGSMPLVTLFPGNRASKPVADDIKKDNLGHLPIKGRHRKCALSSCSGTPKFSCVKCNVGFHPECFYDYHMQ